jgi:hypothetical protein
VPHPACAVDPGDIALIVDALGGGEVRPGHVDRPVIVARLGEPVDDTVAVGEVAGDDPGVVDVVDDCTD